MGIVLESRADTFTCKCRSGNESPWFCTSEGQICLGSVWPSGTPLFGIGQLMVRLHDSQANRPTEAQQEDLAVRQTCEEFTVQRGLDIDPIFFKGVASKKVAISA